MGSYRRLTDAEALALNRGQLLDRIGEENAYWERRKNRQMSAEDRAKLLGDWAEGWCEYRASRKRQRNAVAVAEYRQRQTQREFAFAEAAS